MELIDEPSAEERAAKRKAARTLFRVYCIACGRSSEGASAPARLSRCEYCGGTMLIEPVAA
jgi:DNA-directed RNA polymerase subunit RPC12/RpoP